MKTAAAPSGGALAPIVSAAGALEPEAGSVEDPSALLLRARGFAEPLLMGRLLDSGEAARSHAEGVSAILGAIGAGPSMQAAVYLVYAGDALQRPQETVARAFGPGFGKLVELTRRLMEIQRATMQADDGLQPDSRVRRVERVRKMLLAFSRDLRVVLLRLASRLQTLRWHAAARVPCPAPLARESLEVFAPLASRLGIWPVKWELEDLAFRLLQPAEYQAVARLLDQKRRERELALDFSRHQLEGVLRQAGVKGAVQGRAKHLYSIWKKMQGKGLPFESVLDLRALRVIVDDVAACYAALSAVHARYRALPDEFDDYIARPKPNGYQSLHTVVQGDDGRPMEVQIRTAEMHERAEQGVAAHWAYKEAGARGYAGVSVDASAAANVAQARQAVMRQLLAWEREFVQAPSVAQEGPADAAGALDDRIYVLTPQAEVAELPRGATPVDFAYSLHTDLGHRCRGARVDGALVPLNTPLDNGQTVEIVAAREGGPSLDWLNPELAYLASPRARAKVRAWFNLQALRQTIARGRELVEKLLQREGRTALKFDELAVQLGFDGAQALFEAVGKDEFSLRNLEALLRPVVPAAPVEEELPLRKSRAGESGVLVVGVESLMTTLSRCCRPAPPDEIGGFVTRGRGVAVHRAGCTNFRHMAASMPDRVIPVQWGAAAAADQAVYPLDVSVEAADRQGLLRDISEVFARERVNVTGVHTHSVRDAQGAHARMTFTVEASDSRRLGQVLRQVQAVPGVRTARRL